MTAECPSCAAKPGSPVLCERCLTRRAEVSAPEHLRLKSRVCDDTLTVDLVHSAWVEVEIRDWYRVVRYDLNSVESRCLGERLIEMADYLDTQKKVPK